MCRVVVEQIGSISSVLKIVYKITNPSLISQKQDIVNKFFIIYWKLTAYLLLYEQGFLLMLICWGQVLTSLICRRVVCSLLECRSTFFDGNQQWSLNVRCGKSRKSSCPKIWPKQCGCDEWTSVSTDVHSQSKFVGASQPNRIEYLKEFSSCLPNCSKGLKAQLN